jgi:hypothetical protein
MELRDIRLFHGNLLRVPLLRIHLTLDTQGLQPTSNQSKQISPSGTHSHDNLNNQNIEIARFSYVSEPHLLGEGRLLVHFSRIFLALPLEVIRTVPMTLAMQVNMISLRLQSSTQTTTTALAHFPHAIHLN